MKPKVVCNKIKQVLSTDLLSPFWRERITGNLGVTEGHCYVAAEAAFHMLGGKNAGYKAYVCKQSNGDTHWFIRDHNNNIIDPTAEQYLLDGQDPPYDIGRPCGFMTSKPSKRAREVIKRISLLNHK